MEQIHLSRKPDLSRGSRNQDVEVFAQGRASLGQTITVEAHPPISVSARVETVPAHAEFHDDGACDLEPNQLVFSRANNLSDEVNVGVLIALTLPVDNSTSCRNLTVKTRQTCTEIIGEFLFTSFRHLARAVQ